MNCGKVYKNKNVSNYRVTKFLNISEKIIPFFKKYPLIGIKSKDYEDFCTIAEMMKEKKHLTLDGLEEIHKLKTGMNSKRDKSF